MRSSRRYPERKSYAQGVPIVEQLRACSEIQNQDSDSEGGGAFVSDSVLLRSEKMGVHF